MKQLTLLKLTSVVVTSAAHLKVSVVDHLQKGGGVEKEGCQQQAALSSAGINTENAKASAELVWCSGKCLL